MKNDIVSRRAAVAATVMSILIATGSPMRAAELPGATRDMLASLKLDSSVLSGLEAELKVPQAWLDGAKKEGKAIYLGTFNLQNWPKFVAVFNARYPFAQVEHQRTNHFARVDKPLIAAKEGRVIADIIGPVGARIKDFKEAGALMDLRDLPNFRLLPEDDRAKDGTWVGEKPKYWCMSYNKKSIKKEELPKTWDDLLTSRAFGNGRLGITDRPHNWVLPLWTTKGEEWTRSFVRRLFADVRPQLRKEGAVALVKLNMIGEFDAAIPATDYRVREFEAKGAPISWHCPEPIPVTLSELVVLKGTSVPNTVKIFLNWYLSKEGQIAIYYSTGAPPVRNFADINFNAYPAEIRGKKRAVRTPDHLVNDFDEISKVWNAAWKGAGGFVEAPEAAVKTVITEIKSGGRVIAFKAGNDHHEAKLSASRTRISVGGKNVKRNALKVGQACEITYAGNGGEAKSIVCR